MTTPIADKLYILTTLTEVANKLDTTKPVFFDTETAKANSRNNKGFYGKVALAQFYQGGWPEALIVHLPEPKALYKLISNYHVVMHNSSYDITTLQDQSKEYHKLKDLDDTLILARFQWPRERKYSLGDLVEKYGITKYSDYAIDKVEAQKANWDSKVIPDSLLTYSAIDVIALSEIYSICKEAKKFQEYQLDIKILHYCFEFQLTGLTLDLEAVDKLLEENTKFITTTEHLLKGLNVKSPKQVKEILHLPSSAALVIKRACHDSKFEFKDLAELILKLRKVHKLNGTYLVPYKAIASVDGRVRGVFKPTAASGRFTCSQVNLQQNPRGIKLFKAAPGKVLVSADYSQLELRAAAATIPIRNMADILIKGGDVHDYAAKAIFGSGYTKEHRRIAKHCNFGLLYGMGAAVFADTLLAQGDTFMPIEEATQLCKRWKSTWPDVVVWQRANSVKYRNKQLTTTGLGRSKLAIMYTDFCNFPVQGFAAVVAKLGLLKLKEALPEKAVLCNFIHDEFIIETTPELAEEVSTILASCMQEAWVTTCNSGAKIKNIPMPVSVKAVNEHNEVIIEKEYN